MSTLSQRLTQTLFQLLGLPSTSGHEEQIRGYLEKRLTSLGLVPQTDPAGNVMALWPGAGVGRPVLLNAHMDRVPPGLAHTPVVRDGVLYSDGTTNLGADDAAGIALILELLRRVQEEQMPGPPLLLVFTVEEEVGLRGASAFDPTAWGVSDGIVFDNAFEAGVVVSEGASYVAFDVDISGRTGHPGKDLSQTVDALEIFRSAAYPSGSLDQDRTRITLGRLQAGSARNAIPGHLHIEGELRSFEPAEVRQRHLQAIQAAFEEAASRLGGSARVTLEPHCTSYQVDEREPLLQLYREVLEGRGEHLCLRPTFIGSDTGAFRPRVRVFTLSTGVANEHSAEEYLPLAPLSALVDDVLAVLRLYQERYNHLS